MGRPPKKIQTEETLVLNEQSSQEDLVKNEPSLTDKAFGIATIDGVHHVITIAYCPVTSVAQVLSTEQTEGKIDAQNRFKVKVAQSLFTQQ